MPIIPKPAPRELPVHQWSEWDSVSMVKAAIRQLELGLFHDAALVVDAMSRDDRIASAMLTRNEALPSLPFTLEPGKGARAAELVKRLTEDELFEQMCPDDVLKELQGWGHQLNFALGENVWEQLPDGMWLPKLKVWHPRHVYWRHDTQSFWLQTEGRTIELALNTGQWVVFTPQGINRCWMRGLARTLYVPWLVRQWGWRDWARYSEVHGQPIRAAKTPANADEEDKQRFLREVARLGSESVIRLPRGSEPGNDFELELIEAVSTGFESFDRLLERAENAITVRILGQNLTTEVKGKGSYAAAQVHASIKAEILQADAEVLGPCIKKQILEWWALFNFGDKALAPCPKWNTEPPADKKDMADSYSATADAIAKLRAVGAKPDVDKMLEVIGVPVKGPSEEPPAPQEAQDGEGGRAGQGGGGSASLRLAAASQRLPPPATQAEVEGQVFVDQLAATAAEKATAAMAPDLATVLACVQQATSYADMTERVAKAFASMGREAVAEVMRKAYILAELDGRYSALEDV